MIVREHPPKLTRTCVHCGSAFTVVLRGQGHRQRYCSKRCVKAAWKRRNPEKVRVTRQRKTRRDMADPKKRERQSARTRKWMRKRKEWLDAYKRERGCVDCGTREGALDFDHRPGVKKLFRLSAANRSWANLKAEIAKCDVRCRSCHQRRHGRERGGLNEKTA